MPLARKYLATRWKPLAQHVHYRQSWTPRNSIFWCARFRLARRADAFGFRCVSQVAVDEAPSTTSTGGKILGQRIDADDELITFTTRALQARIAHECALGTWFGKLRHGYARSDPVNANFAALRDFPRPSRENIACDFPSTDDDGASALRCVRSARTDNAPQCSFFCLSTRRNSCSSDEQTAH